MKNSNRVSSLIPMMFSVISALWLANTPMFANTAEDVAFIKKEVLEVHQSLIDLSYLSSCTYGVMILLCMVMLFAGLVYLLEHIRFKNKN